MSNQEDADPQSDNPVGFKRISTPQRKEDSGDKQTGQVEDTIAEIMRLDNESRATELAAENRALYQQHEEKVLNLLRAQEQRLTDRIEQILNRHETSFIEALEQAMEERQTNQETFDPFGYAWSDGGPKRMDKRQSMESQVSQASKKKRSLVMKGRASTVAAALQKPGENGPRTAGLADDSPSAKPGGLRLTKRESKPAAVPQSNPPVLNGPSDGDDPDQKPMGKVQSDRLPSSKKENKEEPVDRLPNSKKASLVPPINNMPGGQDADKKEVPMLNVPSEGDAAGGDAAGGGTDNNSRESAHATGSVHVGFGCESVALIHSFEEEDDQGATSWGMLSGRLGDGTGSCTSSSGFGEKRSTVKLGKKKEKSNDNEEKIQDKKMTNIFDHQYQLSRARSGSMIKEEIRYWFQDVSLKSIVTSRRFEMSVAGLILSNACFIGIQTDWGMKNIGDTQPGPFRVVDVIFMVGFSVELILRVAAEKTKFISPKNQNINWNVFDSLLVVSSWIEEILAASSTGGIDMSAMQMLRITRLIRVLRVIRVMRVFTDLRKMVQGILSSLKSLVWCLLLLLLIMFVFGVAFMQVASGEMEKIKAAPENNVEIDEANIRLHFGSLVVTIYTLYISICGGLDWGDAAEPLMSIHPILGMMFAVYIAFAVFCVLNIVTGVFVENATKITQQNDTNAIMDELAIREMWTDEVQVLFKAADADGSGELDWDEFEICLREERIQKYFKRLGLSLEPECVYALFQLLDFDGDGTVDMDEFVEGCTHVHGNARSLDVVRLRHENKIMTRHIEELRDFCVQSHTALLQNFKGAGGLGNAALAVTPRGTMLLANRVSVDDLNADLERENALAPPVPPHVPIVGINGYPKENGNDDISLCEVSDTESV